jgi:hypothetical protein
VSSFRIRPQFEHTLALSPEATRARLGESFRQRAEVFEVHDFPGFLGLHIHERDRRFWSPRLLLEFEPTDDGLTRVHGTYGPETEVWSIFLYGYLLTGLGGMFGGVFGISQLWIGAEPWGLWIIGTMAVLAGLLYLGAQLGQKLGAWQTFQLHQAYQEAVKRPAELH